MNLNNKTFGILDLLCIIVFIAVMNQLYNFQILKMSGSLLDVNTQPLNQEEAIIQTVMKDFIEAGKKNGVLVDLSKITYSVHNSIEFTDYFTKLVLDRYSLGRCDKKNNHVAFRKDAASVENLLDFRAVVYHELAHCLYGLPHDNTKQEIPVIMSEDNRVNWRKKILIYGSSLWDQSVAHLFDKVKQLSAVSKK